MVTPFDAHWTSDFRAIFDAAGATIFAMDLQGKVQAFNRAAERLLGWRAEEVVGRHTPELWLEAGELTARAAELSRELKRPVKPGVEVLVARTTPQAPEQRDWTFRHRDGHHFRARLEVAALRNPVGEVHGFVGTAYDLTRLMIVADERDITDERLLERQLQRLADDLSQRVEQRTAELVASESLHRVILQRVPAPLFVYDRETLEYLAVSDVAVAAYGYSREEFSRMKVTDIRPAEDIPLLLDILARSSVEFEQRGLWRHQRKDGSVIDVDITTCGVELAGRPACIVLAQNVTERLQAERALHASEARKQAMVESSLDCIITIDRNGTIIEFNRAAEATFGHTRDQVLGRQVADVVIPPNYRSEHTRGFNHYLVTGEGPIIGNRVVTEALRADGSIFPAELTVVAVGQRDDLVFTAFIRDVTERQRAECELQASELRYRSIVQQSPELIFLNRDDEITFVNQAGMKLLRAQSTQEIVGRSPYDLFHPDYHAAIRERIERLQQGPSHVPLMEERIVALDGTEIDVDVQASSFHRDGRLEIQVVCRDVTERRKFEQQLREARAFADTVIESVSGLFYVLDEEGYYVRWNENLRELLGLSADEMRRTNALSVVYEPDRELIAAKMAEVFAHGQAEAEGRMLVNDEIRHYLINGRRTEVNGKVYLAGLGADISDRIHTEEALEAMNITLEARVLERTIELAESERFNRATLDALSAHVAVVNHQGDIVAANQAWKAFAEENDSFFHGVSEGENYLKVCDAAAARGEVDGALAAKALREIFASERTTWLHEYSCHSPTEQRWFLCHITRCRIHDQIHAVVAHENVTSIRRTQEELRIAKVQAELANQAKSEFLATMSHELRTPLNGILGMNDLLLTTELSARQREFVQASSASGKQLIQLINDILDLSKIEAGKLELDQRECDFKSLVESVAEMMTQAARQKGLSLNCELAPEVCRFVLCDDGRLRQILINLVGNALKFTATGDVFMRGARVAHDEDTMRVRIEVRDTGIGIPDERRYRLFTPFSQIDTSTTRRYGGTGLGLSICRQLVELMGGEIGVESQVGVGSTFWFEIPVELVAPSATHGHQDHRDDKTEAAAIQSVHSNTLERTATPLRGHVLVAEDNHVNQLYMNELLAHFGLTCDIVANGEEAVSAVERKSYALILMDCQMPEMDGFAATRAIRRRETHGLPSRRLPIVALTANALQGDRERCLEAGMDEYVRKPVDAAALRAVLVRFLDDARPDSSVESD